jgi:hypothetical protein
VIYFTQDTLTKAIKIGYSKNPEKRLNGLQSASPSPLLLLGKIHGGLEHESAFHEKFEQFRLHGEWFSGDILATVMEIIARNTTDRPPPSNVIVIGDNDFREQGLVNQALSHLHEKNPIAWIIVGGDRPLEHWAGDWARQNGAEVYNYYPNWRKYGRFAAFKLGPQMLRSRFDPKLLLAFQAEKGSAQASRP